MRHISEPRVFVFYSPHQTEYMTEEFKDLLRRSDILIVEAASQRIDAYEIDFNSLCRGKFSPKAMRAKYPYAKPQMVVLYELLLKTRKRIIFEKSPITDSDLSEIMKLDNAAISCAIRDEKEAIMLKRKALLRFADINNRRDAKLADLVHHTVSADMTSRVLAWRGIAHRRRFGVELNKRGISNQPFVAPNCSLGPLSSLAEKMANGESVSDDEIAPRLTERIV